ncbi:MAG: tRNA preQ1(34) S-adenosylmethionine ribosyltransferase-isomerase QueA [Alphaproteobacteria bacterium]|nr:tRNA preQ1(34) S-adenosylmethionine ribosyltransferase-isomerase QueA [Alphaproteobacteria bacterium]
MKVDAFDFALPPELIATEPARPRDSARLLVADESLRDRRVADLPDLLRPGDLLVVNDTRVIPARLVGQSGDARIEVTLLRAHREGEWSALARPAKRCRVGARIAFAPSFEAEILRRGEGGEIGLRFGVTDAALDALLARHGRVPLPPYIRRPGGPTAADAADYQTIFARTPGAVAAPTAGLHFTPALLDRLRARGIASAAVTLHVGVGTFAPLKVADTDDHRMHGEWGCVGADAVAAIRRARADGGRVVAVGTTSLRVLEFACGKGDSPAPFQGECDLFITPGYRFKAVDRLLTNFHLPRSTLFMLVCAFAGLDRMRAAYAHAMGQGYRFYSYGDACLLSPAAS